MSLPVSVSVSVASQPQTPKAADDVNRRSAHFSPSCWGDHFLSYASVETNFKTEQDVQELKEKVKRMIMSPMSTSKILVLVDDIQRLGVARHFENEIEEVLQQIHKNSYGGEDEENDDDLYTSALRFRLLRQQGYKVSCDMFNKFKDDDDGKFKKTLVNDVVGLLSLYEATHLRMHGEDLLDEALAFTTRHLTSSVETQRLSPSLAKQVTHALYQPFWKGFTRLEARIYLSIYEEEGRSQNETLLTLAKLDFNLVQQVHQEELSEITRWWKDLDFVNKLPFARDRIVESYFWALGVYFEPEYYFARMILAKVIALITIIDDIYDVYGTADELEHFAEVVERWDILAMDNLPEYMKFCYQAMLDFYTEIEQKFGEDGDLYRSHYAREAMKFQIRSYLNEVKWLYQKYTPTVDEYLSIALGTSYFMLATTSLVGMGDIVTKDSFEWIFNEPKIVNALSVLGRLMGDMRSHKFEQKRGHIPSVVECYMKENGATEEETIIELNKLVNNAWMDINEEWLNPTTIPRQLLLLILNFARANEVIYKYEDGFTHAEIVLKDSIVSLFVEPVAI